MIHAPWETSAWEGLLDAIPQAPEPADPPVTQAQVRDRARRGDREGQWQSTRGANREQRADGVRARVRASLPPPTAVAAPRRETLPACAGVAG